MGFLPSKILWFERVARFFFYVHNVIKIHFSVYIMPYQHGGMKHIIPLHFPIFIIDWQCKTWIIPIPAIRSISVMLFTGIFPEMLSSRYLRYTWQKTYLFIYSIEYSEIAVKYEFFCLSTLSYSFISFAPKSGGIISVAYGVWAFWKWWRYSDQICPWKRNVLW